MLNHKHSAHLPRKKSRPHNLPHASRVASCTFSRMMSLSLRLLICGCKERCALVDRKALQRALCGLGVDGEAGSKRKPTHVRTPERQRIGNQPLTLVDLEPLQDSDRQFSHIVLFSLPQLRNSLGIFGLCSITPRWDSLRQSKRAHRRHLIPALGFGFSGLKLAERAALSQNCRNPT